MREKRFVLGSLLMTFFLVSAYAAPAEADLNWQSCDWKDSNGITHHVQCAQTWVEVTDVNRDCTIDPGFDCIQGSTLTYRLNTFVYLPCDEHVGGCAGKKFPAIQQRIPYGIGSTAMDASRLDPTKGSTARSGSILRGWQRITDYGYAAVFQDSRGRYGSEGADHLYSDDDRDGAALVDWIAGQPWSNGKVGASGSSAGAVTAYAAAARTPSALKAIFAQTGNSSGANLIHEGQSIELERLMLWVSGNIVNATSGIVGLSDFSLPGFPSGTGHAQLLNKFGADLTKLKGDLPYLRTLGRVLALAESPTSPTSFMTPEWLTLPLLDYSSSCGTPGGRNCNTPPPSGYTPLPHQPPALPPYLTEWHPYLNECLLHPNEDAFRNYRDWFKTINIPVLMSTNWYDISANNVITTYLDLQKSNRGMATGNQKLFVGSSDHYGVYWDSKMERFYPTDQGFDPGSESDPFFEWFDYWLKGEETEIMERPSVYYSPLPWVPQWNYSAANCYPETPGGALDCYWSNCEAHRAKYPNLVCQPGWNWRYADQWPFPDTKENNFYLGGEKTLSLQMPRTGPDFLGYTYNPLNPVPTFGGRNLSIGKGPEDQTPARTGRTDVLTYSGEVLKDAVTIAGNVKVVLYASSNRDDTDFVAKLIDYSPDPSKLTSGTASLVQDGVIRAVYRNSATTPEPLVPGKVYQFTIDLGEVMHVFPAGHIIQLDVTSSNFPRRARNPNNHAALAAKGESIAAASFADVKTADNRIYNDPLHPSHVELPIYKPWATAFTGDLQVTKPAELAFNGMATLYTFPTGIYLRFGPTADGKWHWRKWTTTEYNEGGAFREYHGTGKLGPLNAIVKLKEGQFEAQAESEGIKFRKGTKVY